MINSANMDRKPSLKRALPLTERRLSTAVNTKKIARLRSIFEDKSVEFDGVEIWLASDLQKLLHYKEQVDFDMLMERAKESCSRAGVPVENHFVEVDRLVDSENTIEEYISDVALTRYACYLIAQNGSPDKEPIAFAQTYFALQTRKQEVLEERFAEQERLIARERLTQTEKELSSILYERGVDDKGFGVIRSKGDAALFGGNATIEMKRRLGVSKSRALADFLPTVTIKAKDLAAEMTNHMVSGSDLAGPDRIGSTHIDNNKNVRKALTTSGIYPEKLPAEEDIKKVKRRIKSEEKTLPTGVVGIPASE